VNALRYVAPLRRTGLRRSGQHTTTGGSRHMRAMIGLQYRYLRCQKGAKKMAKKVSIARKNQDRINISGNMVTYWDVYCQVWRNSPIDAIPVNVLRALSADAQRRIKAAYRRLG